MRPTPAAVAMPAMLTSGSRARQSVAASRIAATLRRASARCARGAVLRAPLEGIPKIPFPNSDVRVNLSADNSYMPVQVSARAGPRTEITHARPRPQARTPGTGSGRRDLSRAGCRAPARDTAPRAVTLGRPGPACVRAADARPGRHGGERGAAGHWHGPAPAPQRAAVGDDDLHDVLWRAHAAGRTDRRPVRRAPADPGRAGPVHRVVTAVRAVPERGDAARRAVAAGHRRGADVARRAGHRHDAVPRLPPRQGAGGLVGARRR